MMEQLFEALIKRSLIYFDLKKQNAPSVLSEEEEKLINELTKELSDFLYTIANSLKLEESESIALSPCSVCNNCIFSNDGEIIDCKAKHIMDQRNVSLRIKEGCDDYNNDNKTNYVDKKEVEIDKKYSEENIKLVMRFICDKLFAN